MGIMTKICCLETYTFLTTLFFVNFSAYIHQKEKTFSPASNETLQMMGLFTFKDFNHGIRGQEPTEGAKMKNTLFTLTFHRNTLNILNCRNVKFYTDY